MHKSDHLENYPAIHLRYHSCTNNTGQVNSLIPSVHNNSDPIVPFPYINNKFNKSNKGSEEDRLNFGLHIPDLLQDKGELVRGKIRNESNFNFTKLSGMTDTPVKNRLFSCATNIHTNIPGISFTHSGSIQPSALHLVEGVLVNRSKTDCSLRVLPLK